MKIVFRFEASDLEAFARQQSNLAGLSRTARFRQYLIILAIYIGCLFVQHFFLHGSADYKSLLIELVVLPGTFGASLYFLERKFGGTISKINSVCYKEIGTHVYELTDDVLSDRMETKTDEVSITEIASIERRNEFVLLLLNDMRSGIIPVNQIVEGNIDDFVAAIQQHLVQKKKNRGLFQFD